MPTNVQNFIRIGSAVSFLRMHNFALDSAVFLVFPSAGTAISVVCYVRKTSPVGLLC